MVYKIKRRKGRPKVSYKIRSIKGITPKGFKFHKIKKRKIIFKKKNEK